MLNTENDFILSYTLVRTDRLRFMFIHLFLNQTYIIRLILRAFESFYRMPLI